MLGCGVHGIRREHIEPSGPGGETRDLDEASQHDQMEYDGEGQTGSETRAARHLRWTPVR